MKQLLTRVIQRIKDTLKKSYQSLSDHRSKEVLILEEITYLSDNDLSLKEIELFLGIDFNTFDEAYFKTYFSAYQSLIHHLNIVRLCSYISFIENLKNNLRKSLFQKLFYPVFLIIFAFMTLVTFKYSVLKLLDAMVSTELLILVNTTFIISVIIIIIIFLILVFVVVILKNPAYFIMVYYQVYKFKILRIIEMYYLIILSYLLLTFSKDGMSTNQIFRLINQFKGNTIISNLAYFVTSDLEEGKGLEYSITQMRINSRFKQILLFGIKSNNFEGFLGKYSSKLNDDIFKEINMISKSLFLIAYIYIGVIVLLLYKIISLPISLIDTI